MNKIDADAKTPPRVSADAHTIPHLSALHFMREPSNLDEIKRGESATPSQKEFERETLVSHKCCGLSCTTNTKIFVMMFSLLVFTLAAYMLVYELHHQTPCECCGWDLTFSTSVLMFILGFWMPAPK